MRKSKRVKPTNNLKKMQSSSGIATLDTQISATKIQIKRIEGKVQQPPIRFLASKWQGVDECHTRFLKSDEGKQLMERLKRLRARLTTLETMKNK